MDKLEGWAEGVSFAITVTDESGRIVSMNPHAAGVFAADGGMGLLGSDVFACHPEPSRSKLEKMFEERRPNHYTISKAGKKKIIHQLPWFREGTFAGFVELSIEIPEKLPHFNRG